MRPRVQLAGNTYELDILARRPKLRVGIGDRQVVVSGDPAGGVLVLDGRQIPCVSVRDGDSVHVRLPGRTLIVKLPDPRDLGEAGAEPADSIVAPMPGAVVALNCSVGDRVAAGDVVLTIESMKLQMNLTAPRAAVVARISVAAQATFEKGQLLVQFEAEHGA